MKMKSESEVTQSFPTPWTAAHQAPPSMGFSRQEYWSGETRNQRQEKKKKKQKSQTLEDYAVCYRITNGSLKKSKKEIF